jgi:hypothetical protein
MLAGAVGRWSIVDAKPERAGRRLPRLTRADQGLHSIGLMLVTNFGLILMGTFRRAHGAADTKASNPARYRSPD